MKKIISLVLVLVLAFSLAACGGKGGDDKIVLKVNIGENEEHGQGVMISTFKNEVEKLSGGQIEVQLYFSSSLYNPDATLPAVKSGELEMTATSFQLTADYYAPITMFASPFLFKDYEHMRKVMSSEIGENLAEKVKETAGYYPLAYYYNGSRQLNLTKKDPVMTPADMKGVILRMPNAEAWIQVGEALGASVQPLAYSEVYTALQTGTIDAQDNPLPAVNTMKFYEVTEQISLTNHIVDAGLLVINNKVWESMNEEQQGWVKAAAETAVAACDAVMVEQEKTLISFFESEGLLIVQPDQNAFAEYAKNYYTEKGLTANWDMDLYEQIRAMAN